ncbi:membrane stabilizing protein MspA [Staphylococcus simiae]|uniref:Transmembrane protein n=1 Tax=Staphylococcus simiae CCM 7213 = CCUG 51256 TaxID=911238 RepID=G5JFM3_9STAP|nr:membrane stabilizing protein MspA [Staphylococcus simiae]EHJ09013.1 hypothetical protein SS7213T_01176 [Staphylococcus simiae CCM 7213 = CCUG 51256]PNZ13508.1 hypothetical protein CD113_04870 [Staphylococcus simiae]SNV78917.1 Uncharacterised protein [Staphylococcus simiae]
MQFYLILLAILYLVVSYISIFKMDNIFTRILRIIMGVLLLFVLALTTMHFPKENWWVFIVLLLLVGNVEITSFKMIKKDLKGVNILNLMSIFIFIIYCILALILF